MKTLLRYLSPYKVYMSIYFLIKVCATLTELILPYMLSHILKNVVITQNMQQIAFWGVLMLFFSIITCIGNIIANRMVIKVTRNFTENIRRDLFAKMLRLSSAQTDRLTIASLESRVTSDIHNLYRFFAYAQRMGVRAPIIFLGGAIITMIMDSYLSTVMLAIVPFIFVATYFTARRSVPLWGKVQKSVDRMVQVVREDVQGIRIIKALSKDNYERQKYDAVNKELVKNDKHAGRVVNITWPLMGLLMNVGIIVVVALGAVRVQNNLSDPETVIAFMQYFTLISMSMHSFSYIFVKYSQCVVSARRVEEILLCENELELQEIFECAKEDKEYIIEFENVNFSYNQKLNNVSDISFSLKKGQSLGIIGATGSGKSTLIKLLLRLYDVSSGAIRLNGKDIRTIPQEEMYAMFGTAMQNDFLYADTIYENIRFGRELTEEAIVKAAIIAQAHDFITSFADGYQHVLSQKATNISGGQKQRLLISRALASKPEILILDDSSSALDYKTEANLRKALNENLKDMTVITVAQRVSAVMSCDLILVMDEGRIIDMGTHEHLIENCIEYREIRDSQMGGAFID